MSPDPQEKVSCHRGLAYTLLQDLALADRVRGPLSIDQPWSSSLKNCGRRVRSVICSKEQRGMKHRKFVDPEQGTSGRAEARRKKFQPTAILCSLTFFFLITRRPPTPPLFPAAALFH